MDFPTNLTKKFRLLDIQLEDFVHQLPLCGGGGGGVAALELGDVGLPFGLARKGGETGVVGHEVEVIDRVHDHEKAGPEPIDLHVQDAHLADAGLDFRPDMGMGLTVLFNHLRVVPEVEGLTVTFHGSIIYIPGRRMVSGIAPSGKASGPEQTRAR